MYQTTFKYLYSKNKTILILFKVRMIGNNKLLTQRYV